MKKTALLIILSLSMGNLAAQREINHKETEWYKPAVTKVIPANNPANPPSDAIILFDGKDLSMWESDKGSKPGWKIENGELKVVVGTGNIRTKEYFGDCQLHLEFKSPKIDKTKDGQNRGNSGVFLQSKYEVQILDGEDNPTYVNGMVGSIYKQYAPIANPYTKSEEWQVYDIYFKAPVFGTDGKLEIPGMMTVILNGVLIQNNVIIKGGTEYIGYPKYEYHGRLPLWLQNHGEEVSFRNIWIRDL